MYDGNFEMGRSGKGKVGGGGSGTVKHVIRGNGRVMTLTEKGCDPPLPPWPTTHPPGSPKKISVMKWRAKNGYHIHHPDDASRAIGYGVVGLLTVRVE